MGNRRLPGKEAEWIDRHCCNFVKRIVGRELQSFPKLKIPLLGAFEGWCATTELDYVDDAYAGVTLPFNDAH